MFPFLALFSTMFLTGKTIRVFQNGEELAAGRRLAVNKYNARTFESALEMVS